MSRFAVLSVAYFGGFSRLYRLCRGGLTFLGVEVKERRGVVEIEICLRNFANNQVFAYQNLGFYLDCGLVYRRDDAHVGIHVDVDFVQGLVDACRLKKRYEIAICHAYRRDFYGYVRPEPHE